MVYIVIAANKWGRGKTIAEAIRNTPGYKKGERTYIYTSTDDTATVDDLGRIVYDPAKNVELLEKRETISVQWPGRGRAR